MGEFLLHAFLAFFGYKEFHEAGSAIRHVECEQCHTIFVFVIHRTGHGRSSTWLEPADEGRRRARNDLQKKLAGSCDLVPCPGCGKFQEDMVKRARRLGFRWMNSIAWFLVPVTAIVGLFTMLHAQASRKPNSDPSHFLIGCAVLVTLLCLILGLFLGRPMLASLYDPNRRVGRAKGTTMQAMDSTGPQGAGGALGEQPP